MSSSGYSQRITLSEAGRYTEATPVASENLTNNQL